MSAADIIATLRTQVTGAKAVPMSASCIVNRAETLALLDKLDAALEGDLAEASSLLAEREEALRQARREADRIVHEAELKAEDLVRDTPVYTEAKARAEKVVADAGVEAEEIRREADAYVDGRIAELEAGLTKTFNQISTMRARLAERSRLEERFLGES